MLSTIRLVCVALVLVSLGGVLTSCPAFAQAPSLSASAIIDQSVKAYDALTSYSCQTTAISYGIGGLTFHTSANIQFVRPGQLIATGSGLLAKPFQLIVNGSGTSFTFDGQSTPTPDIEHAMAMVAGDAGSAATDIPALLLRSTVGYPFRLGQAVSNSVITQPINGRPCYMVIVVAPIKRAFWIDTQTFLIAQISTKIDLPGIATMHSLVTITNSQIDPTIPPSAFSGSGQ
jgi:outer membrane lipoprotein-sorting protein